MAFSDRREARRARRRAEEQKAVDDYDRHLAQQKLEEENSRANLVYLHVRRWLLNLEKYHDVKNAPNKRYRRTECRLEAHWSYAMPTPAVSEGQPTSVRAAIPLDRHPQRAIQEQVINALRADGFRLDQPQKNPCGCVTFTAYPRCRP